MLHLGRTKGQRIIIQAGGEIITIEVLRTSQHKVYLGLSAPPEIIIDREEIYERNKPAG